MGKASRGKRQKELQVKSILKNTHLESGETSSKWSLFHKPPLHILLIAIVGFLAYSNTFDVPFHWDDTPNIVENYKLRDLNNLWPPTGSRWFGFLTFALNYNFGGLDTVGYHIVNIVIHIFNAILIYWLVMFTFRTPYFSTSNPPSPPFNKGGMGGFALFSALLFISHPIQTQAVTYIVQRFTSLATMFYLLSLVMYIKFRIQRTEDKTQNTEKKLDIPNTTKEIIGNSTSSSLRLVRNPSSERFPTSGNDTKCGLTYGFLSKYAICHLSSVIWYLGSVFSAILAMKTKEITFTLPFIIILYEFCFFKSQNYELRTMNLRRLLYLMPFLLTLFIIPLSIVGIDKPIGDAIGELREAAQETEEIPRWSYLITQFRVIVTYIRLLFLPIKQNLDYDYPIYNSFLDPNVFLSFLFLLSIFGLGVYLFYRSQFKVYGSLTYHPEPKAKDLGDSSATPQTCPEHERRNEILPLNQVQGQNDMERRNDIKSPTRYTLHPALCNSARVYPIRLISFGIFWFFITLSVESSIIPIRDVIFEHRVYLPSVGAIVAFGTAVFRVFHRATEQQSNRAVVKGKTAVLLHYCSAALIVIALSVATYQRNTIWKDEVSLWEDVVRKSPNKARGYDNLAASYIKADRNQEAIEYLIKALSIDHLYPEAYNDLGQVFINLRDYSRSIEFLRRAIELKPDFVSAYNNLGIAYAKLGNREKAIEAFKTALDINPLYLFAIINLGNEYMLTGYYHKATYLYTKALEMDPTNPQIYYNLGLLHEKLGKYKEAIEFYSQALKIKPDYFEARKNLESLIKIK